MPPPRPPPAPVPVRDPVRLVPRTHLSPATLPGAEEADAAAAARVGARHGAGSILRPGRGRAARRLSRQRPQKHPPGEGSQRRAGLHGEGAAGGSGRRLPALPPCPERRLSRAPERGGAGEGPAAGRERQGSSAASPPAPPLPPRSGIARARRCRRPEPGRAEPGRPPRRARPCPVSRAAAGHLQRAGTAALGSARYGTAQPPRHRQRPSRESGAGRAALADRGVERCEQSAACTQAPLRPGKMYELQQLDPKWSRNLGLGAVSKGLPRLLREKAWFRFAGSALMPCGDAGELLGSRSHLCWPWHGRERRQLSWENQGGKLRLAGSRAQSRCPEEPTFC